MPASSAAKSPHVRTPVRYHVPGVVSHVRRAVLHNLPLLAGPVAARTVLSELNTQAAIYGVHLLAVVIRAASYDVLLSHTSAKGTAQFLCLANKSISHKLRPREWTSTFWNGDRPGVDLVTGEAEAWGDKLLGLLHEADEQMVRQLLAGFEAGSEVVESAADQGPVLLVQVAATTSPGHRLTRKQLGTFVGRVRAGLSDSLEAGKSQEGHSPSRLPGSRAGGGHPRRRRPRLFGLLPTLRAALAAAWRGFQDSYRQAAEALNSSNTLAITLGFPRHCLGPPLPTPD